MTQIIAPTILVSIFEEFVKQAKKSAELFTYIQVDVMDGIFVPGVSFSERKEINELNLPLRYELHLMVNDPVLEMRRWREVDNAFRVIFHHEAAAADPLRPINFARKEGWEVGVAINPDTPFSAVLPYLDKVDVLQFMTVYPGQQGAAFVPKVLDKIREFISWRQNRQSPLCAVDGAVNKDTIAKLKNAGVEIFNVGSALIRADDWKKAYGELKEKIN